MNLKDVSVGGEIVCKLISGPAKRTKLEMDPAKRAELEIESKRSYRRAHAV